MRVHVLRIATSFAPFITHVSFCLFEVVENKCILTCDLNSQVKPKSLIILFGLWTHSSRIGLSPYGCSYKTFFQNHLLGILLLWITSSKTPLADCLLLINTRRHELSVSLIICSQWTHYGICRGRTNAFKVCTLYLSLKVRKDCIQPALKPWTGEENLLAGLQAMLFNQISGFGSVSRGPSSSV